MGDKTYRPQKTEHSQIPVHEDLTTLSFSSDINLAKHMGDPNGPGGVWADNGIQYENSFMNAQLQKSIQEHSASTMGRSSGGQIDVSTHVSDAQLTQAYLDMQTEKVNHAIDDGVSPEEEAKLEGSDNMDEWSELKLYQGDDIGPKKQAILDARFQESFPGPQYAGLNNKMKVQLLWSERLSRPLTQDEAETLAEIGEDNNLKPEDVEFLLQEIDSGGVAYVFEDYKVDDTTSTDILSGGSDGEGLLDDHSAKAPLKKD